MATFRPLEQPRFSFQKTERRNSVFYIQRKTENF